MGAAPSKKSLVARTVKAMAAKFKKEEKNTKSKRMMEVFFFVDGPTPALAALDVSRNDTVASVKESLHDILGIPPGRQRLVFSRSALPEDDDNMTLGDHGVADKATILLVDELAMAAEAEEEEKITKKLKVSVVVPTPSHAPVALEVSRDDTVASVKEKLHDMVGIPPHRQRVVFACSALPGDDDTMLADHGVADSATIQLVETNMNVFVRTEKTLHFSGVESSDTVESIRIRLQEQEGVPPRYQRLIYHGWQLEDDHTLADYSVQDGSTLHFVVRLPAMRTRVVELDIEVTDTVGRIKELVEEAEGVPVACQSVYYCADELDDRRTLADYDALEWVHIVCRRHETVGATNTATKTVKGQAKVDVTGPGEKAEKRRLCVYLKGPELAAICPSSCDTDPTY